MAEDKKKFDVAAAKAAGYTDREIEEHLYGKVVADENAKLRAEGGTGSFTENLAAGAGKAISDAILGGKQLVASYAPKKVSDLVGGGDVERLNREAAEKERIDKALSNTAGGMIGDYGTQALSYALPTGGAVKAAAKFLPKLPGVAGAVTGTARFAAPGAAVGAAQGVLTPDKDYDPVSQATLGAAGGVAGDVVGRTVGRVVNPALTMASKKGKETLARVREAFPNATLNAENLTDNKYVKILTNLLSDTPVASKGVAVGRRQNLGDVTEKTLERTGVPSRELSPSVMEKIEDRAKNAALEMEKGYVPMTGMSTRLSRVLGPEQQAMELGGYGVPNMRRIGQAVAALHPSGPPYATGGGTPAGSTLAANTILPARTALNERILMTTPEGRASKKVSEPAARAISDEMERALKLAKGEDTFNRFLEESGATQQVRKLYNTPNAVTKGGQLRPEAVQKQFSDLEVSRSPSDFTRDINAAADRFSTPQDEMSRTLMQRVLAGSAIPTAAAAVGGLTGFGTGDVEKGIATGAGSLYLAHLLLGTPGGGRYLTGTNKSMLGKALQSDAIKKYIRSAGISGGVDLAEDR
jgi:hypothetical protein